MENNNSNNKIDMSLPHFVELSKNENRRIMPFVLAISEEISSAFVAMDDNERRTFSNVLVSEISRLLNSNIPYQENNTIFFRNFLPKNKVISNTTSNQRNRYNYGVGNENSNIDFVSINNFNDWWSIYPKSRRNDKNGCFRKFTKLDFDTQRNILEHTKSMKQTEQWKNEQFVPNATTYLNQCRWEMDVPKLQPNVAKSSLAKSLDDLSAEKVDRFSFKTL